MQGVQILNVVLHALNSEALREQFEAADTDNSGSIDAEELHAVCKQMGENISLKQCKAIISEVDDDNSVK